VGHWQTTLLTTSPERALTLRATRVFHLVSPQVVVSPVPDLARAMLVRDPDGHGIRLASR